MMLHKYLKQFCAGKENAQKEARIAQNLDLTKRQVRLECQRLRKQGIPIGYGNDGIFLCRTLDELEFARARLREKALDILEQDSCLARLERELIEQERQGLLPLKPLAQGKLL